MADHFTSIETKMEGNGYRAVCICGWQSGKWDTEEHAVLYACLHDEGKTIYGVPRGNH